MKKKLAYTGYVIGVTVLCLYLLFPTEAVTSYINYKINAMSPDLKWSLQGLKPDFPLGLSAGQMELFQKEKKMIQVENLSMAPSLISLLTSEKSVHISGNACDGKVDAKVAVSTGASPPGIDLNATFDGVQIAKIPALAELKMFEVAGAAKGTVTFSRNGNGAGKGNVQIAIGESHIQFTPALFGIGQVGFKTINAELGLDGQMLTLKRLDIDSRDVSGNAGGSVTLGNPIEQSRINITGELTPHPGMIKKLGNQFPVDLIAGMKTKTGGIPFRISGTVEQPNFSFK